MKNKHIETKISLALALVFLGGAAWAQVPAPVAGEYSFGSATPWEWDLISMDKSTVDDSPVGNVVTVPQPSVLRRTAAGNNRYRVLATDTFEINAPFSVISAAGVVYLWGIGTINNRDTLRLQAAPDADALVHAVDGGFLHNYARIEVFRGGSIDLRGLFYNHAGATTDIKDGAFAVYQGASRAITNDGTIVFQANSYFSIGSDGFANSLPITNQSGGRIAINLPLKGRGIEEFAKRSINQTGSHFTIQSASNQAMNALVFDTATGGTVTIGGAGGTITMASADTKGANLELKGPLKFNAMPVLDGAPKIVVSGDIYLDMATPATAMLSNQTATLKASTVDVRNAVFHLKTCPAANVQTILVDLDPALAVANVTGVSGAGQAQVRCVAANGRSYQSALTLDAVHKDIVVNPALNPWALVPIPAIPANAPWSLALVAAALAFLGRKRIQKT